MWDAEHHPRSITDGLSVKNHGPIHKQIKLNGIIGGVKGFIRSLAGNYTHV